MAEDLFLIRYRGDAGERVGLQLGEQALALNNTIPSLAWLLRNVTAAELAQKLLEGRSALAPLTQEMLLPPVDEQEVWAAGVTYKRSEEARERESGNSTIYTRVYSAQRPELFFKALGADVVSLGQPVGIRYDAAWSIPEPELVVVLNARLEVVGFTVGNDMSSRDIEGENPLYLPQAKVYEGSCAVGPRIWLQPGRTTWPDASIQLTIQRGNETVFHGETSTTSIHRPLTELVSYLGRCKSFKNGVLLFTGTGIVPPDSFTLAAGDEVRIAIPPIGELVNRVSVIEDKTK